jgi:hypothetical protein
MTDPEMTPDEFNALVADAPDDVAPVGEPQEVPCDIHTMFHRTFLVEDIGGWVYQELGIFAQGYWADTPDHRQRSVLLPYEQIQHIEFNFEALARYHEAQEDGTSTDD